MEDWSSDDVVERRRGRIGRSGELKRRRFDQRMRKPIRGLDSDGSDEEEGGLFKGVMNKEEDVVESVNNVVMCELKEIKEEKRKSGGVGVKKIVDSDVGDGMADVPLRTPKKDFSGGGNSAVKKVYAFF